ncbi:MAG: GNAT family N-acetyltransferase [Oscillospiraceae bacterium]|nr:GNAT family N-acetyltransferase [Oscillospiraceae bacterium]
MIEIRSAALSDADRLLEIYEPYVRSTAVSFEYEVPTPEEFRERIRNTLKKYPYLVLVKDGRIEGYAYAGVFKGRAAYDWACETTIYLDRGVQKCGLGRMLYEALETELKKMGILNLYACIAYPETEDEYLTVNSAAFHDHLGYRMVGVFKKCAYKFGRWYDMVWMEKMLGEHKAGQLSVCPYPQVLEECLCEGEQESRPDKEEQQ